jgi:hypothetical protein
MKAFAAVLLVVVACSSASRVMVEPGRAQPAPCACPPPPPPSWTPPAPGDKVFRFREVLVGLLPFPSQRTTWTLILSEHPARWFDPRGNLGSAEPVCLLTKAHSTQRSDHPGRRFSVDTDRLGQLTVRRRIRIPDSARR